MKKKLKVTLIFGLCAVIAVGAVLGSVYYFIMNPPAPKIKADKIKVACIGDSITQGFGIKKPKQNSYPAQLQKLLGEEYQTLNYGLNRRCLLKDGKKPNKPYTNERFYKLSQKAQPDIVLIMLGTNDTKPENWNAANYEKELEEFVNVYQNLESAPDVYLLKPPPIYPNKNTHDNETLTDGLIPIIEAVAVKTGIQTIDIFTALSDKNELFKDGLHPDADGAAIIAQTVYGVLEYRV